VAAEPEFADGRAGQLAWSHAAAVKVERIENENGREREFGGTNPILSHMR